jgi:hypothetical protein
MMNEVITPNLMNESMIHHLILDRVIPKPNTLGLVHFIANICELCGIVGLNL